MSTKQAAAKRTSSKAKTSTLGEEINKDATKKGTAMAQTPAETSTQSVEELEQQIKQLQDAIATKLQAERKPALTSVLAQIKRYNFTAKELGFTSAPSAAPEASAPAPEGKKVVLLSYKPNTLGKATTFAKGDKLPTPQKSFRELYEKDKENFAENLKALYQPGAAEYFETKEGKDELAYFIQKTTRDVGTRAAAA